MINGKIKIELVFQSDPPEKITRGMSLPIKVFFSDNSERKLLLSKGGFYTSSNGQFVFVLTENDQAEKRAISIGKTNPYYYEILDGLKENDRVITSSYQHFKEMDLLILN